MRASVSQKISSPCRAYLAGLDAKADPVVRLLIRVSRHDVQSIEALREKGATIQSQAGDVISAEVRRTHLGRLASLDNVISMEISRPLYPEQSEAEPRGEDYEQD